jgi:curved DNA-binding protein CbpA
MTYYEELGISADASAEEIRQAHRRLVKLLHPDQHQDDEDLRRLADLQLMRVNALVAELLDSSAREAYDARLRAGSGPVAALPSPPDRPAHSIYRWAACVISGLAIVALLGVRSPTDVVRTAPGVSASGLGPAEQRETAKGRSRKSAAVPGSQAAVPEVRTHTPPVEQQDPPSPAELRADPEKPVAPQAAQPHHSYDAPPANPDGSGQGAPSLSGIWLYAGGKPSELDKDLYRPEFIELRLRENGGLLHGDYRSRYAVTDLAITPSVNFTFEGKATGESWRWRGTGGATGTLTIRQLHRNAIQVDWRVTDFGANGAGLEFGTATLVRRM